MSGKPKTRRLPGLGVRPLHGKEARVCLGSTAEDAEELCWVLACILIHASSHGTNPPGQDELHQCSAPAQPQSWEVVPALISQNPIKLGRPFKPNCVGTAEHSLYVKGGALCTSRRGAAAFPRKLLKVLQQRGRCQPWHAFLLVLLPRPLRSTPVIPWGPASQAELSPSQFYYWVVKKPKKRGWIAAMPFQWLTPLFLYVYCYNKSLQSFCRCYIS